MKGKNIVLMSNLSTGTVDRPFSEEAAAKLLKVQESLKLKPAQCWTISKEKPTQDGDIITEPDSQDTTKPKATKGAKRDKTPRSKS